MATKYALEVVCDFHPDNLKWLIDVIGWQNDLAEDARGDSVYTWAFATLEGVQRARSAIYARFRRHGVRSELGEMEVFVSDAHSGEAIQLDDLPCPEVQDSGDRRECMRRERALQRWRERSDAYVPSVLGIELQELQRARGVDLERYVESRATDDTDCVTAHSQGVRSLAAEHRRRSLFERRYDVRLTGGERLVSRAGCARGCINPLHQTVVLVSVQRRVPTASPVLGSLRPWGS